MFWFSLGRNKGLNVKTSTTTASATVGYTVGYLVLAVVLCMSRVLVFVWRKTEGKGGIVTAAWQ